MTLFIEVLDGYFIQWCTQYELLLLQFDCVPIYTVMNISFHALR